MLDLNPIVYLNETRACLHLTNVWIGLFYSLVFGVIIALCGVSERHTVRPERVRSR